jgi:large subunit ribosomal protein L25
MADLEIRAERRDVVGKRVRLLRRQGLIPGNLYGPGAGSAPLQLPAKETEAVLRRTTRTTLLPLIVGQEPPRRVLVREVQRHPVSEQALHVDFYAPPMDEPVRTAVPLHFVGEAPAVAQLDGTIIHSAETVEIEALPGDLPARLDVDLSGLEELHSTVHVRDLVVPPGVKMLSDPETTVATVVPPAVLPEEEEAAAAEAAPEEAAPAEPAPAGEGEPTA